MINQLKLLLRSLVSDGALAALYDVRKAQRPAEENRTKTAMIVCSLLLLSCMGFLLHSAWSRHDTESWLKGNAAVTLLDAKLTPWHASPMKAKTCDSGTDCYTTVVADQVFDPVDPHNFPLHRPAGVTARDVSVTLWQTSIGQNEIKRLSRFGAKTYVASLPEFSYRRADIWVNGSFYGTLFESDRLGIEFDHEERSTGDLQIHILFEIAGDQIHFARAGLPKVTPLARTTALMPLAEWRAYQDFLATNKAGRGNVIGTVARIVMAAFVLLLFLLIDGSPETLGLGLFLGFEAFAITCGYGWLPIGNVEGIKHFAFQMGDIFRVYFFLQLARVIDKRIAPWLIWGTVLSIFYGLGRQYGAVYDWTWLTHVPRARDFTAGLIGIVVCLRTAYFLRGKNLNWRVIALTVAAVGAFEQFLEPATIYFPAIRDTNIVQTSMDMLQPIGVWLLAFSAFINISTLENRVRVLSGIEAQALEMQNEMELGRKVQKAFLSLPELPPEMHVACHHEAMLYVSGDTYFVDWNEKHQKLTFLINDVTGHGVQAALKASGVAVIASTIWADRDASKWRANKLTQYGTMVAEFFGRMDAQPDLLAMGGAEFDSKNGKLTLYRVNFPFPILIEPKHQHELAEDSRKSDNWRITLLPIRNAELTHMQLVEGSFVVITSDGFLDDSRRTHGFLRHMRKHLGPWAANLAAEDIKNIMLSCTDLADRNNDDRTLTIFQWRRGLESIPNRAPRAGVRAA